MSRKKYTASEIGWQQISKKRKIKFTKKKFDVTVKSDLSKN